MYSRNSFGSYYPVTSLIHKLNPIKPSKIKILFDKIKEKIK